MTSDQEMEWVYSTAHGTRISFTAAFICTAWWCDVAVTCCVEVTRQWTRLVLGRVTVYGQLNHLGMKPAS